MAVFVTRSTLSVFVVSGQSEEGDISVTFYIYTDNPRKGEKRN